MNILKEDFRHLCAIEAPSLKGNLSSYLRFITRVFPKAYGFHILLTYRFYRFSCFLAKKQYFYIGMPLKYLTLLLHKIIESLYDIHLSLNAEIAEGFYIGHFGGIHIGCCRIGRWCNINQQVKIAATTCPSYQHSQVVIGDRVWVGAHSIIECGVIISSGVTIAAGTHVTKDIPASVLVAGASCRILQKNYDNSFLLGDMKA